MKQLNLYEAKTHFSKVINHVAETGETYIIARNGTPMVKIVPVTAADKVSRLGFMAGEISAPENFNELSAEEIAGMFGQK